MSLSRKDARFNKRMVNRIIASINKATKFSLKSRKDKTSNRSTKISKRMHRHVAFGWIIEHMQTESSRKQT